MKKTIDELMIESDLEEDFKRVMTEVSLYTGYELTNEATRNKLRKYYAMIKQCDNLEQLKEVMFLLFCLFNIPEIR